MSTTYPFDMSYSSTTIDTYVASMCIGECRYVLLVQKQKRESAADKLRPNRFVYFLCSVVKQPWLSLQHRYAISSTSPPRCLVHHPPTVSSSWLFPHCCCKVRRQVVEKNAPLLPSHQSVNPSTIIHLHPRRCHGDCRAVGREDAH